LRLRVKDLDFGYQQIVVRDGKGNNDRVTMLPSTVAESLKSHLASVKSLHIRDLQKGFGKIYLPFALMRKYPNGSGMGWQYLFPAATLRRDRMSNAILPTSRRRVVLQKAVKDAVRASGINKPASCNPLRHSFATHLLEGWL
jgi:integrase